MHQHDAVHARRPPLRQAAGAGISMGVSAGLLGASCYLGLYCVSMIVSGLYGIWLERSLWPVLGALGMSVIVLLAGMILGITPAIVIGSITGTLISVALWAWWLRMTLRAAQVVGGASCLGIAIMVHLVVYPRLRGPDAFFYGFALGVPTLIYLGLGIWLSGKLYRALRTEQATAAEARSLQYA